MTASKWPTSRRRSEHCLIGADNQPSTPKRIAVYPTSLSWPIQRRQVKRNKRPRPREHAEDRRSSVDKQITVISHSDNVERGDAGAARLTDFRSGLSVPLAPRSRTNSCFKERHLVDMPAALGERGTLSVPGPEFLPVATGSFALWYPSTPTTLPTTNFCACCTARCRKYRWPRCHAWRYFKWHDGKT